MDGATTDDLVTWVAQRLDDIVSKVVASGDVEAAIAAIPLIDVARRAMDRMQADPPRYRPNLDDGYSRL